jgi:hypothetical protein
LLDDCSSERIAFILMRHRCPGPGASHSRDTEQPEHTKYCTTIERWLWRCEEVHFLAPFTHFMLHQE